MLKIQPRQYAKFKRDPIGNNVMPTFEDIYNQELVLHQKNDDIKVNLIDTTFKVEDSKAYMNYQGKEYLLMDSAVRNLLDRVDYPVRLATGLPEVLVEESVNYLTTAAKFRNKEYLLRTREDEIRAVLSSDYSVYDNIQLLDQVRESVNVKDYSVGMYESSSLGMFLRLYSDDPTPIHPEVGDDIRKGLEFGNSETGFFSLNASLLAYFLICSNGCGSWRKGDNFSVRHAFLDKTPDLITNNLQDLLGGAVQGWMDLGDRISIAKNTVVEDPEDLIRKTGIKNTLWAEDVKHSVLMSKIIDSYSGDIRSEGTVFDVHAAFTRTAHTRYSRQQQQFRNLEVAGESLLMIN